MSVFTVVAIIAIVAYVIGRQLVGEPIRGKRLLVLPAIVAVIGAIDLGKTGHHPVPADFVLIVIGVLVAAAVGAGQGISMRLESRQGALWGQMPMRSLWLWGALLVSRGVLMVVAHGMGAHVAASSAVILFGLGVNRLAEAGVVTARAVATGIPFAPEKDGASFRAGLFVAGSTDPRENANPTTPMPRGESNEASGIRSPSSRSRRSSCSMKPAGDDGVAVKPRVTLQTGFWLVRIAVFVFVFAVTLGTSEHQVFQVSVVSGCVVLFGVWVALDWRVIQRRPTSTWLLPLTLGGIAFLGGLPSVLDDDAIAIAAVVALVAGADAPFGQAVAVLASGVLGIEISGVMFGYSTASAFGWPLVLVACLLVGRNRREVRLRVESSTALVAEMERAQEEERLAAALGERNRIAREIHDVLAHSLSALGIQIEAARAVLGESGDITSAMRLLDIAQRFADDGLVDSRRAIHALRTDTPPLPDGLASLVGNYELQHHRTVDLAVNGAIRPLQPAANLAFIRVADEALTNVAKYASDNLVSLCLDYGESATTLTISDLGSASAAPHESTAPVDAPGGYGLAGMRERLLLIGGTLTAGASPNGWTVRAQVPE